MSFLKFELTLPGGAREVHVIESERALVGTAEHCDVRLPLGAGDAEHVAVELLGDVLRFSALGRRPPPTLNGHPFAETSIHGAALVGIGPIAIDVSPCEAGEAPTGPKRAIAKRRPTLAIAALIAGALVLTAGAALVRARRLASDPPVAIPALWENSVRACPVSAPDQALALANEKRIAADGRRERHPFVVADGVEAVVLYEMAAACFARANQRVTADEMTATAEQLRAEVNDDYRVRRLRLTRALVRDDRDVAAREVVALRSLVVGRQGEYVDWLNRVARRLQLDTEGP